MNNNPIARRAHIKDLSNKAEGIFQYVGNDNVLFRLISTGNELTSNVNFTGAKAADKPAVQSFDQQTANHVREANAARSAPQAVQEASGYSQGSADDFAVISDTDDLPF